MKNRFEFAVNLQSHSNKKVLDLGCRDKSLKKYLHEDIKYQGVDFQMADEVVGFDVENGIPFEDNSFDIVFALDILEHLENIHFILDELKRVAKNEIVIALPNCYHWHYKLNILMNKPINTKYEIPLKKILDRHRWVTFHDVNLKFIKNIYKDELVNNYIFICNYNRYKFLYRFDKILSNYFPNTFSYTDFFHIKLTK